MLSSRFDSQIMLAITLSSLISTTSQTKPLKANKNTLTTDSTLALTFMILTLTGIQEIGLQPLLPCQKQTHHNSMFPPQTNNNSIENIP